MSVSIDPMDHIGLAYHLVRKAIGSGYIHMEYEDACQEACLALVEAARAFDPSLGYQFNTLAGMYVKRKMQRIHQDENTQKRKPGGSRAPLHEDTVQARSDSTNRQIELDNGLAAIVASSSERDRLIYQMRVNDRMTWQKIGEAIGTTKDIPCRRMAEIVEAACAA